MSFLTIDSSQAEEWLYFHQGKARATVFLGNALARTFDFSAGDTAVFPDNSGKLQRAHAPRVAAAAFSYGTGSSN